MAKQLRKLTAEEDEANRRMGLGKYAKKPAPSQAGGIGSYDNKRSQLEAEQRAAVAAKARAVEEDPNTPSRRRQHEIAKKSPSGFQRMLQALGWRKDK